MKKPGNWIMRLSTAFVALLFVLIAGMANFIMKDTREALLDDAAAQTEFLARAAREAMSPKLDLFWLHLLVNDLARDKIVRYVLISDEKGRVLSHSLPEKIGAPDNTPEGLAARKSPLPRRQVFKGADGLRYYYFSSPIILGGARLGTAAAALNTVSIASALADTRQKLLVILGAAFIALLLLFEIRYLVRKEQAAAMLKSDMVRTVSHEFNNALTSIDACVFMLEESESPDIDEERKKTYKMLISASKLLKLYVKNILNEARMESGKFRIQKSPVALLDLTNESMSSMAELVRQKNLSAVMDIPADCQVLVDADPEALALVVANLIGNAVKYTPNNGKVRVSVSLAGTPPRATFQVEDTGHGIAEHDLKKIMDGFYRTSEGRSVEGYGLGLKITNDMLLLHGTSLQVRSEPGKGSVFGFSLPVNETTCGVPSKPRPPAQKVPSGKVPADIASR